MVLSDYNEHKQRTAVTKLREFIEKVENDETLDSHLYDIGDGVMIIRRK
jgi:predicted O-methyltransferase YrrM